MLAKNDIRMCTCIYHSNIGKKNQTMRTSAPVTCVSYSADEYFHKLLRTCNEFEPSCVPYPLQIKKKTPHRKSLIHKHLLTRFHFFFKVSYSHFCIWMFCSLYINSFFFNIILCFPNYCGPFLVLRSRDKYW